LEVLWVTGFGMIMLALLIRTPLPVIATIALIIFFGHNILNYISLPKDGFGGSSLLFSCRHSGDHDANRCRPVHRMYCMQPFPGAAPILLGYVFGSLYQTGFDSKRRQKILLVSGISLIGLFILLRSINHYGDPRPWSVQQNTAHTIVSFLNTTKQVPSLLFFSMTLGPLLIFLAMAEKTQQPVHCCLPGLWERALFLFYRAFLPVESN
jgi:uncharacterized membrane protein